MTSSSNNLQAFNFDFSSLKKLKVLDLSSQTINVSYDLLKLKIPESLELLFVVSNNTAGGGFGFGGAGGNAFQESLPKLKEKYPSLKVFTEDLTQLVITRKPEDQILDLISSTKDIILNPNYNHLGDYYF